MKNFHAGKRTLRIGAMLFSIAMLMAGNSMEALAEGSRENTAIMEENMVQEPEKPELLLQDDEISRYGAKTTLEAGEKTYKPYQSATYELVYKDNGEGVKITGYTGTAEGKLVLPETIEGKAVNCIGESAFSGCSGLTGDLVIPAGVTSIDGYAFEECSGFTGDLVIPSGVTSIEYFAFYGCDGFTGKLVIPTGVTNIGYAAFSFCSGFTGDLVIPDSVTLMDYFAFSGCSGFTGKLEVSDNLTQIAAGVFENCSGLTGKLEIPSGVTSIGNFAFENCSGLTGKLEIPSGVTSIKGSAFSGCSGFTGDLVIPDSVTSIGYGVFSGCSGFTGDLIIPNRVESIGHSAFSGCSGLNGKIYIPQSVLEIGAPSNSVQYEPFQLYGENSASSVIIYGWAGSYAESYAEEKGYDFVVWEVENPKGEPLPNASVVRFVERMYEQCLARKADRSGKVGWVSQLEKGYMTGGDIAKQFVFGQEMVDKNLSDAAFVEILYKALLGRAADEAGKAGWVSQLEKGNMTRMEVTKAFAESTEFTQICASYGIVRGTYDASESMLERFVLRFYNLCLERNADQPGLYGWVSNLKNGYMNGAQIADAFFFSKEFTDKSLSNEKYVELLYKTILGRTPATSETAGWIYQLNNRYMTRRDILKSFVESIEFTDICNTYGIVRGNL